ncbi:hypothetical protein [Pseudomonas lundensis]|uniref:hypothetical protein n=1 Tax=Pseudomonas lundensis TaxID=86185 RepID=UPI0021CCC33D|nr:hypothetical protein [Pseudomonas lundensis]
MEVVKSQLIIAMGQLEKKTSSITSLTRSGEKSFRTARNPLIIGKPKATKQELENGAPNHN